MSVRRTTSDGVSASGGVQPHRSTETSCETVSRPSGGERRNERTPSGDAGRSVTYYRIGFGVGAPAAIVFDDELCRDLVLSLLVGDPGTRSPEWWGDEIRVDEAGGSPFRRRLGVAS